MNIVVCVIDWQKKNLINYVFFTKFPRFAYIYKTINQSGNLMLAKTLGKYVIEKTHTLEKKRNCN